MNTFNKELETAVGIAREAGKIIFKYFDDDQKIEQKEDNTPVTIADKMVNSLVIERLIEAFPEDGIVGEEESTSGYGMGRKWLCDPIDGTAGYVWGTPTAMFSLALVIDGKPVAGVAYDPFLDKMYTGEIGEKSYCNGKVLSVSNKDLKSGIVAVTGAVRALPEQKYFQRMIDEKVRMACFSGAVYKACLVATGRLVAYTDHGVGAYDLAASEVIVKGAGGKVTSVDGKELDYSKPFTGAIVSNGIVHEKMIEYCK